MLISPGFPQKSTHEVAPFPPMRDLGRAGAILPPGAECSNHSFSKISRGGRGAEPPQTTRQGRPVHIHANNFSAKPCPKAWRAKRHALRETAGAIVGGRQKQCGCKIIAGEVSLNRSSKGGYVGGVETCGSVWTCPVCSVKVTEARREHVKELFAKHKAAGGLAFMATYTLPHKRFDRCKDLLASMQGGWSFMKAGRGWSEGAKLWSGWMGDVRALEVTHGENGWHPHLHVVWFLAPGSDELAAKRFAEWSFGQWASTIEKRDGLICDRKAFDWRVIDDDAEAEYLSKWGAAEELTRAHTKTYQGGGSRTPFQILRDFHEHGDPKDAALFREFANAFRGARQLTWSRDIRKIYEIGDVTDEEAAALVPDDAAQVSLIEKDLWRSLQKQRLKAKIHHALEEDTPQKLIDLMSSQVEPVAMFKDGFGRLIFAHENCLSIPGLTIVSKPGFNSWLPELTEKWLIPCGSKARE